MPHQDAWWLRFFNDPACLRLGNFPGTERSAEEAAQIAGLLGLPPGALLLDCPCGPGRHLPHWQRLGLQPVGADIAPMMLKMARRACPSAPLVRADMRRLPFKRASFDAVVNLFNSFGYFESDADNQAVIDEAARCLKPGGVFLLDTRNPVLQILLAPYGDWHELPDGRVYRVTASYDRASRTLTVRYEAHGGGPSYTARLKLYSREDIEAMLGRAGLQVEAVLGSFQGEPFEQDCHQMIFLARRK